jgi:hypothetical protein
MSKIDQLRVVAPSCHEGWIVGDGACTFVVFAKTKKHTQAAHMADTPTWAWRKLRLCDHCPKPRPEQVRPAPAQSPDHHEMEPPCSTRAAPRR